jgi:hypothetical protein
MRTVIPRGWGLQLAAVLAAAGLLAVAGPARAIPRPLSPEELEKQSDAIVTVRVLGVACTGQAPAPRGKTVPTYQAWLLVLDVKKGTLKKDETILVHWRELPRGLIGGAPPVRYYPGEEVLTHLKWDAGRRQYGSTFYNAKGKPIKMPATQRLPEKPGDIISVAANPEKPIKE